MPDEITLLMQAASDAHRKASQMVRPGVVYESRKGKVRVVMGQGPSGELYLSPWLDTHDRRGGARVQHYYKKNQSVHVVAPNGDPAQAYVAPYSPNDEFPPPDHAEEAGEEAETYQLDYVRKRFDPEQMDWWITPEKGTVTQTSTTMASAATVGTGSPTKGSTGQSQTPPVGKYQAADTSCGKSTKAVAKHRINKKTGITGRWGIDGRYAVNDKCAKLRYKEQWLVVSKDPPYLRVSEPPVISEDPSQNDDE